MSGKLNISDADLAKHAPEIHSALAALDRAHGFYKDVAQIGKASGILQQPALQQAQMQSQSAQIPQPIQQVQQLRNQFNNLR